MDSTLKVTEVYMCKNKYTIFINKFHFGVLPYIMATMYLKHRCEAVFFITLDIILREFSLSMSKNGDGVNGVQAILLLPLLSVKKTKPSQETRDGIERSSTNKCKVGLWDMKLLGKFRKSLSQTPTSL